MFKLGKEPINEIECKLVNVTVSIQVFNILSITSDDICKGICNLTFLFIRCIFVIGISSFLKEGIGIGITLLFEISNCNLNYYLQSRNFYRSGPNVWKSSLVLCLLYRAKFICSSQHFLKVEIGRLKRLFYHTNYPTFSVKFITNLKPSFII